MHRICFVRRKRRVLEGEKSGAMCSHKGRWMWLVCANAIATVLLVHGISMKGEKSRLQVPRDILSQVDINMEERDPSAIHIMQMVMGSKSPRFQMVFLKSLLMHHFENGQPNPAPIHLHFLTDDATRFIVEGILESWRLNQIRLTFYAAEPIQAKIGWMRSRHSATKVATMKMYLPEILNSTVAKVLLIDSDSVFMTDVVELWRHFDRFGRYQFLGMAIEQATMPFDFTRFGGNKRSFGYNAGIMMWYVQRLTQAKWDAIWQPTLKRTMAVYTWLPAAEQTLINTVILDNPDIFYLLPCTWNLQMYEAGHSEDCLSTWNRPPGDGVSEPKLLHADRVDKLETKFWLNESLKLAENVADITKRYIAIRSQYHMRDGYQFRHQPIEAPVFDFRKVMSRLHPNGQVDHKKLTEDSNDVTLAVSFDITNFEELESLATHWNGFISAALHATDGEAHTLLIQIANSRELKNRNNIFYHVVYRNSSFPESVALHNTAVVYSPTRRVLLIPHPNVNIAMLNFVIRANMARKQPADTVVMVGGGNFSCSYTYGGICALREDYIFDLKASPLPPPSVCLTTCQHPKSILTMLGFIGLDDLTVCTTVTPMWLWLRSEEEERGGGGGCTNSLQHKSCCILSKQCVKVDEARKVLRVVGAALWLNRTVQKEGRESSGGEGREGGNSDECKKSDDNVPPLDKWAHSVCLQTQTQGHF
ncbi:LARGE xylosyl and glucuronyltransferase 2 [Taenia crassiceps]|uniref:LARGE xylosyl and glucuronyltransferase 2 n=1 Tax=Taenia crassiceps TaxID=6207 RepID=A0ABR4QNQ2_9CEST